MNRAVYILGFLVVLFLVGNVVQRFQVGRLLRESETDKRSIKAGQKESEHKIDSMARIQSRLEMNNGVLVLEVKAAREQLTFEHQAANQWRKKYATIKNSRLPAMSDHQLDSVVSAIVARQHD